jgi:hypothetical protein
VDIADFVDSVPEVESVDELVDGCVLPGFGGGEDELVGEVGIEAVKCVDECGDVFSGGKGSNVEDEFFGEVVFSGNGIKEVGVADLSEFFGGRFIGDSNFLRRTIGISDDIGFGVVTDGEDAIGGGDGAWDKGLHIEGVEEGIGTELFVEVGKVVNDDKAAAGEEWGDDILGEECGVDVVFFEGPREAEEIPDDAIGAFDEDFPRVWDKAEVFGAVVKDKEFVGRTEVSPEGGSEGPNELGDTAGGDGEASCAEGYSHGYVLCGLFRVLGDPSTFE